ncbi:hypothetical protein BT93_H0321 [Corymbia citriodora subsp. variegata]|nr:hypothetical protein BT93_H0321 [Corymbia citriodora subsp. variegata]
MHAIFSFVLPATFLVNAWLFEGHARVFFIPQIKSEELTGILISGFFALTKVLTLSAGPLFLTAFIAVADGEEAFDYRGYVLAGGLSLVKCSESLSGRQWYFRANLIKLQIRSFLSAAICQKQLQLSSEAKVTHSPGQIVHYVTSDAYRIGEFPYWFHQIWSTSLQLCLALAIVYYAVGLATLAALTVLILIVTVTSPMAKLQLKLKAILEALANMKVLKLYGREKHFNKVIEELRKDESERIAAVLWQKGYYMVLFWSSPVLVPAITFWACYCLGIPLIASNVFMFLASLRIVHKQIRLIPNVDGSFIQAKVSLSRIAEFLEAPELENKPTKQRSDSEVLEMVVFLDSREISWDSGTSKVTLRNTNLLVRKGEKVAICGEVGSGKSTLLAAILGEVPFINGVVHIHGRLAYVFQTAWIQSRTIQENILFGSAMDSVKYQEVIQNFSLAKDIEMFPFGDQTQIGERGVNLSRGQKQRIQLALALYQDVDVYLLHDPFSAVDAHTAASLFNLMLSGKIISTGMCDQLMASCQEFQDLVNAHNTISSSENQIGITSSGRPGYLKEEIQNIYIDQQLEASPGSQLIKQEEREIGDSGFKPYLQYLKYNEGFLFINLATISHIIFTTGQLVSSDLSIIDIDVAFKLFTTLASTLNTYSCYLVLAILTWLALFKYYYASSNELMRLDGTIKSTLTSHLAESITGVMTIRAFGQEDRFFSISLCLIDANASPNFHSFSANEWLVQRLEVLCAIILTSSALAITFLDLGSSSSGYVGMALAYGLSLNAFLQYMHIQSEAPEVIEDSLPATDWPSSGNVEICNLKVRYRPDSPPVLRGITCKIKGGHGIGIVGQTGRGKTNLISALFHLELNGGAYQWGLDITTIGLHDQRSHIGVMLQDPTLFGRTVQYNLDPLLEHTDEEIWEVLGKCQLREARQGKGKGLESLGRALLRRSQIPVLDEATVSNDNTTNSILQRTIRREFADSTVITVTHRIPTVMDCTMVLAISDGRLVEYDEPMKLVGKEDWLFRQLYKEYEC